MASIHFDLDDVMENLGMVVGYKARDMGLEFLRNNAVKFTQRGKIVVSVRWLEARDRRIRLKFAVRDTGIGMVKRAPVADVGGGDPPSIKAYESMGWPGVACWRWRSTVNQEVIRGLLERSEVSVEIAVNGAEAVTVLEWREAKVFDAVFLDIQIPEMGGYEATRRIRALPGFDRLPIIGPTAHVQQQETERMRAAGMNDLWESRPIPACCLKPLRAIWSWRRPLSI